VTNLKFAQKSSFLSLYFLFFFIIVPLVFESFVLVQNFIFLIFELLVRERNSMENSGKKKKESSVSHIPAMKKFYSWCQ